jgi:cell division transport system ATP-binding protein
MIYFRNVSVGFDNVPVLDGVTFHIGPGEFVCLVGQSGMGKTTLLRLIYFDLLPDRGEVLVNETASSTIRKKDIPLIRRKLGVVFQDFKLLDDRNVYENVAIALQVTGTSPAEIGKRVLRVLADVGLSHKRNSMPGNLSGGEQQRVVIARAIVNNPIVLLADEPTGNLDTASSGEILGILRKINAAGTAVLLASHNEDIVRKSGGRVVRLTDGKLREEPGG